MENNVILGPIYVLKLTSPSSLIFFPLVTPLNLLGADATVTGLFCPGYGFYNMMFTDGTVAHIHMYYLPTALWNPDFPPTYLCSKFQLFCWLQYTMLSNGQYICSLLSVNRYFPFFWCPISFEKQSILLHSPLTAPTIKSIVSTTFYWTLAPTPWSSWYASTLSPTKSAPMAFLMIYINKSIHFTIAKSVVMLKPGKTPWDLQPLLITSSLAHASIWILA